MTISRRHRTSVAYILSFSFIALALGSVSSPLSAATKYSVEFGELPEPNNNTVVPTKRIKMCDRSTGYAFGYEIKSKNDEPFQYSTTFHVPAPVAKNTFENPAVSARGRKIATEPKGASGSTVEKFVLDSGDPIGTWKIDIVVDGSVLSTIKFDVIAAEKCP